MAQKRKHFKTGTLEASSDPHRNILAKRLAINVRYVPGIIPLFLKSEIVGIKSKTY